MRPSVSWCVVESSVDSGIGMFEFHLLDLSDNTLKQVGWWPGGYEA
jgi:hypothetical protein